jgi:hypothetical protein
VAAKLLVKEIQAAVGRMNPSPTDVIDAHWIGHSRGAVVIGQALALASQNGTLPAPMTRGWVKMTMLDPHPAKNGPTGPLCSFDWQSPIGWLLFAGCAAFQAIAQDPDAVFPVRVNQPEVYFQHTSYRDAPSWERFFNLWGVGDIIPGSHNWTHAGIGHAEIPDAYRIGEIEPFSLDTSSASGMAVAASASVPSGDAGEAENLFPDFVDSRGLARSLTAKLAAAQVALDRGNVNAARGALRAFIDEVNAQRGAHIKTDAANFLIAAAESLLSSLK